MMLLYARVPHSSVTLQLNRIKGRQFQLKGLLRAFGGGVTRTSQTQTVRAFKLWLNYLHLG